MAKKRGSISANAWKAQRFKGKQFSNNIEHAITV
jgi:hypothetical protein